MKKYLIFFGINSGKKVYCNPSFLITAKDENDAIDAFRHKHGNEKIQLIKTVNY